MGQSNTEQKQDQTQSANADADTNVNGAAGEQTDAKTLNPQGREEIPSSEMDWDSIKSLWTGEEPPRGERKSEEPEPDTSQASSQSEESSDKEEAEEKPDTETDEAKEEGEQEQETETETPDVKAQQQQYQEYEKQLFTQYQEHVSKLLTEEDVEALQQEPEKVLPKLLANHAMAIRHQLGQEFSQYVPQIALQSVQQYAKQRGSETKLTKEFPQLKLSDPQHRSTVEMVARVFREKNPKATEAEAIKAVGTLSAQMLGLDINKEDTASGNDETESETSQTPQKPYQPAKAAGSASQQPSLDENLSNNKKNDGSINQDSELWGFLEDLGLDLN